MMRIYYCSDLHCDYNEENPLLNFDGDISGVLVVAGDIFGKGKATKCLEEVAHRWGHILWVPGNHDFWGIALHEKHKFNSEYDNVTVLHSDLRVMIGDVTFVGDTCWSYVDNPIDQFDWHHIMNDAKKIRGPNYRRINIRDLNVEHITQVDRLKSAAKEIVGKKVLVTHHPQLLSSIDPAYEGEQSNVYYASDEYDLVSQFDVYIHGHVHCPWDYRMRPSGTRVLCNPHGYKKEVKDFKLRMFEL